MINTVGELREALKDAPDDAIIMVSYRPSHDDIFHAVSVSEVHVRDHPEIVKMYAEHGVKTSMVAYIRGVSPEFPKTVDGDALY